MPRCSKIARDMDCDINGRSRDFVWGFCIIESKLQVDMDAGVVGSIEMLR